MLALKILIYIIVNCGFSRFASLKLYLFIQLLQCWRSYSLRRVLMPNTARAPRINEIPAITSITI